MSSASISAMAETVSSESLQDLYTELLAVSEARLTSFDVLFAQLDSHIQAFKDLLDKRPRKDESRRALATGKIDISGDQYTVNEEFQAAALRLADELNIDELDAARLFLDCQDQAGTSGQTAHTFAIVRFHQRRKFLLDCLRLILQLAKGIDVQDAGPDEAGQYEALQDALRNGVMRLLEPSAGKTNYIQKCLLSMADIRIWLQSIADKLSSASVLGNAQQSDFLETIHFQQTSLVMQHESLGLIVFWLVKQNHCSMPDFDLVLDTVRRSERYDNLLLHYFPALTALIHRYGGHEESGTVTEARKLNEKFFAHPDQNPWALPYVHAAFKAWWLAVYSGWYGEVNDGSISDSQFHDENKQRARQFAEALKDGAFDYLLSIAADSKPVEWQDPARQGLRQWLQRKTPVIINGPIQPSKAFECALMEQLESFIEAFITNLPDVLRKLRTDEDEQRQLNKEHDHDLDLERFLVIMSFAFEGRPKAALEVFWDDRDGALMGFVHWASKRASTPLLTAFCEMLQSISEDEECAVSAHEFLRNDGPQSSARMRKSNSLSWDQIFKELTFFSGKIRDRLALPQPQTYRAGKAHSDFAEAEPESSMMLESYLRLISRLASESKDVRIYLLQHESFHLTDLLFQLASSAIGPRLRACAFTTLKSLLNHKSKSTGESLWTSLDIWISGGYAPGGAGPKTTPSGVPVSSASTAGAILKGLTSGFEEPNAFIQLLQALVMPYDDDEQLRDSLPFPESLGSGNRMAGIDPYIDYALSQIFSVRLPELGDILQQRLLRLTCLQFIATCLDSFNENLIMFANQSNISVDLAMKATDLEHYVQLHPFSRVMEWMYNDRVASALFETFNQDTSDVNSASPDSPLVKSLLVGVRVVTAILDLQATYLDIIKPINRSYTSYRRSSVPNTAFSSFDDALLSHLSIIPELGRYCGVGHPELALASLKLLERISASPKLLSNPSTGFGGGLKRNKALAALDDDVDEISNIFVQEMCANIDPTQGPEDPAYQIRNRILDFLITCLRASPNLPNMAHLLLGFRCGNQDLNVDTDGPFGRGISLFHVILELVTDLSLLDESSISSWLVALSYKAIQVLKELWLSPISSNIVMYEMRSNDAFFTIFMREVPIRQNTLWDGLEVGDALLMSPSASCLSNFLNRRSLVLQYLSSELRQVTNGHSPSLQHRMFDTLMGSTRVDQGQMCSHASVFDLFDFIEAEFDQLPAPSHLSFFVDVDFSVCLDNENDSDSVFDLSKVEELIILRRAELTAGRPEDPQEVAAINQQAQELIDYFAVDNKIRLIRTARLKVVRAWAQLMLLIIGTGNFERNQKTSFLLRTLQAILPRLESHLEHVPEATELAKIANAVIFSIDFNSESFEDGETGDLVSDRLFHLFHVSLKAINSLGSHIALKEIFYNINYRYLIGMSDISNNLRMRRRHNIQTIKSAGERFIDVVCDDALASEPTSRIAALLILGALVNLGKYENSKYIIDSLARLNFVSILVGSIRNIPSDMRETAAEHVDIQLSYCNARLALLLQISQTRFGAAAVLNAGLFHAIKESGLFMTDPDLGVDIEGPDGTSMHYGLLASIMRVICAALLSRGAQNEQSLEQGRRFLSENRLSILAVLKKAAGLVPAAPVSGQIEDLADSFMLLVTFTGFLEAEEQTAPKKSSFTAFT